MNTINIDKFVDGSVGLQDNKGGLFLCTRGHSEIVVNDTSFTLSAGIIHVVSPIIPIYRISQSDDFDGLYLLDNFEVFYSTMHSVIDTVIQLKIRQQPCIKLEADEIDFFIARQHEIEKKKAEAEAAKIAEERDLLIRMIHLLEQETMLEVVRLFFSKRPVELHALEKKETIVYGFIYALNKNFKQERSVSYYADLAHLTTGYFTSVVREKTGQTPSEWIATMTITEAKSQLSKTKKSIKEIADDLNFPEQFTFRKYFKQHTGMSPKEYRQASQQGGK